jgi:hypothetical protein
MRSPSSSEDLEDEVEEVDEVFHGCSLWVRPSPFRVTEKTSVCTRASSDEKRRSATVSVLGLSSECIDDEVGYFCKGTGEPDGELDGDPNKSVLMPTALRSGIPVKKLPRLLKQSG